MPFSFWNSSVSPDKENKSGFLGPLFFAHYGSFGL